MSIYVITDDLTGANDTAVQFAKKGLKTVVFLEPINASCVKDRKDRIEVIVLNTDSRALPPAVAVERLRKAFSSLPLSETDILYKKIDSTLRGNVVVEVEEALRLSKKQIAIVAPAYPKNKRTTVNGIHYVRGIPVAETEAASDPRCPVRHSHLPTLFQTQGSLPVDAILIDSIRTGNLKEKVVAQAAKGVRILVFDAETEEDLQTIVRGVLSSECKSLWVGSAGLAEALSEEYLTARMNGAPLGGSASLPPLPSRAKPVLIILGSMSEVSTHQAEVFAQWAGITPFILPPPTLWGEISEGLKPTLNQIHAHLRKGNHVLLMSDRRKIQPSSESLSDPIETLLRAFEHLGATIDFSLCSGLIVTGGDIAMAVCKGMGVHSIEVLDETSPGIPLGRVRGGRWEGLPLVTKAGAFGAPDAFILAVRRISSIPGKERDSWNK